MRRIFAVCLLVSSFVVAGCAVETAPNEDVAEHSAAAGGKTCTSSADCGPKHYCSTEDGDCFSPCKSGQPCIAVCAGVCTKKRDASGEACGDTTCASGMVCCNASCGICTEPGGVCTQQICTSTEPL